MNISQKVTLTTVSISVISVLVTALLIGAHTYSSGKATQSKAIEEKLIAIRDTKADQLNSYFHKVENELKTLSKDLMIIQALRNFTSAFNKYGDEIAKDQDYKSEIVSHYLTTFVEEYTRRNGGIDFNPTQKINIDNETTFALQYNYIIKNPFDLNEKSKLVNANDGTEYSKFHQKYHERLKDLQEKLNYYDLFLIDGETGNIVYSVFKELDFTTSLIDGPFADTNFGRVFRAANQALNEDFVYFTDFEPYLPSYDDMAAFVAAPIFDEAKKRIGVMVVQLPISEINRIMTHNGRWQDIGLGYTGESYIIGNDLKLRSMSRFFFEEPAQYLQRMKELGVDEQTLLKMHAKAASIGLQVVDTQGSKAVTEGKTGFGIYKDYRGVEVLGAYETFNKFGFNWGIIAEVDKSEAYEDIYAWRNSTITKVIVYSLVVAFIASITGLIISQAIVLPILRLNKFIGNVRQSQDLTRHVVIRSGDEVEDMSRELNKLIDSFRDTLYDALESGHKSNQTAKRVVSSAKTEGNITSREVRDSDTELQDLADKLKDLSEQFTIFEDEADEKSGW